MTIFFFFIQQNIDKFGSFVFAILLFREWENFRLFIIIVSGFLLSRFLYLFLSVSSSVTLILFCVRISSLSLWHIVCMAFVHIIWYYFHVERALAQNEQAIFDVWCENVVNGPYKCVQL